jgi:uncharacterized protein YbaR (Trm112 family)
LHLPLPAAVLPHMSSTPDTTWIDRFLPKFRCPDTHQPLRWATPEECARVGIPPAPKAALARQDGSRVFHIDDGIPLLLPADTQ